MKTVSVVRASFIASLIFTSLLALNCRADSLYLGGYSYHFKAYPVSSEPEAGEQTDFNKSNDLIGYEHKGYVIAHMRNSFYQETYLLTKQFKLLEFHKIEAVIDAGLSHGYSSCKFVNDGEKALTCPIASLELRYTEFKVQPVILMTTKSLTLTTRWVF